MLMCVYCVLLLIFTLCAMPCLHAAVTTTLPKSGLNKYILYLSRLEPVSKLSVG